MTREEAVALVRRFDTEFPAKYFQEIMAFLEMDPQRFLARCDEARSPHLWKQVNGEWKLRHPVN